MATTISVLT